MCIRDRVKGDGGPLGAQLSRGVPDGAGQGGGGAADPQQSGHRVQVATPEGQGNEGADPGGDPAVPHPSQGGDAMLLKRRKAEFALLYIP